MKNCSTCGMPLEKPEDFVQGDENSEFCQYCVKEDGTVKSCTDIFEGGVEFFLSTLGDDRGLAERLCRKNMNRLPYWQDEACECLQGAVASDEEFAAAMEKLG